MTTEELILEILLGQKIRDAKGLWHVYDIDGGEISDPGGILLRGNMGALLMWPNSIFEEIINQAGGSSSVRKKKPLPKASRDEKDVLEMLTLILSAGVLNVH